MGECRETRADQICGETTSMVVSPYIERYGLETSFRVVSVESTNRTAKHCRTQENSPRVVRQPLISTVLQGTRVLLLPQVLPQGFDRRKRPCYRGGGERFLAPHSSPAQTGSLAPLHFKMVPAIKARAVDSGECPLVKIVPLQWEACPQSATLDVSTVSLRVVPAEHLPTFDLATPRVGQVYSSVLMS